MAVDMTTPPSVEELRVLMSTMEILLPAVHTAVHDSGLIPDATHIMNTTIMEVVDDPRRASLVIGCLLGQWLSLITVLSSEDAISIHDYTTLTLDEIRSAMTDYTAAQAAVTGIPRV